MRVILSMIVAGPPTSTAGDILNNPQAWTNKVLEWGVAQIFLTPGYSRIHVWWSGLMGVKFWGCKFSVGISFSKANDCKGLPTVTHPSTLMRFGTGVTTTILLISQENDFIHFIQKQH